ncbi:hypothetical protein J2S74_003924 [Evansella vedderi]|uniref:Uncharacterized protein n=1 Tax=Evansella vedderi TaxID=38282 RepID=A0ABT9ZZ22_9BACI|nr:hypothetical protein [Evansella vedderi]MDQ0256504.1 hypothetical protein [Evansella vedderi]
MNRSFVFIVLIFLVSFILAFFGVSVVISFFIIIGMVALYFFMLISPVLLTNNISVAEKFLKENKSDPTYYFLYSIANKVDKEVDEAFAKVKEKYNNSSKLPIFQTTYALYKGDLNGAREYVDKINQPVYRDYYYTSILIEEENFYKARSIAETLNKKWMKDTVLGELYKKEGNLELATKYVKQALKQTRGIQKYSIYKNFTDLLER